MQLTIECVYKDETEATTITKLFTTVLWERKFKTKLSRVANDGLSQEEIAYLAWESFRDDGVKVPDDFDQFQRSLKSCLPIEANDPKVDAVLTASD